MFIEIQIQFVLLNLKELKYAFALISLPLTSLVLGSNTCGIDGRLFLCFVRNLVSCVGFSFEVERYFTIYFFNT